MQELGKILNQTVLPEVSKLIVQGWFGILGGFKLQTSHGGLEVPKFMQAFVNWLLTNVQISQLVLRKPICYEFFNQLVVSAVHEMEINCTFMHS